MAILQNLMDAIPSLPMRERGLKLQETAWNLFREMVAPHAGAWIEIANSAASSASAAQSLPMRERGLKSEWS